MQQLNPLQCLLVTQTEQGTTEVKKFEDQLALAHYLIEVYRETLITQGAEL